ncbi:hypothetical protein CROQUDRAFT_656043 [Cronartium quercuum f. sp. fusiforme G11]|uniref:Uncharacterized protein n=1 Tax=Cronartium quercuum f. sp. fusiforme G11 TaxID=708437 RepID=A0A9P6NNQ0_9BASI|nr:hypothetical protein CROQUDRAFT_656043 [Cronartium quercuum f. sp. fusiforme G11]
MIFPTSLLTLTYRGTLAWILILGWCSTRITSLSNAPEQRASSVSLTDSESPGNDVRTPGPHGALIQPEGGKLIRSVGKMGVILVEYSKYNDDEARTISIDISLQPTDDNGGSNIILAHGVTTPVDQKNILSLFSTRWACGSYNLVVHENQFYNGKLISFQNAAPLVHFECSSIER